MRREGGGAMTPEDAARLRRAMEAQIRDLVREGVQGYRARVRELESENRRLARELEDMRRQRDDVIAYIQKRG